MKNKKTKDKKKNELQKYSATTIEEAVKKVQELSNEKKLKFIESVDIAINLGIDTKNSDQLVRGSILLPNGSGKKVKVIVFTGNEDLKKEAISSGASHAGLEDLITKIEGGFLDFDCCIATPDVMQKISKVAKKLGPRGLMPSPKNGTVTNDIKKSVGDSLKGRIDFKNDKGGTVHCLVGKVDFSVKSLVENIEAIIKAVRDSKPENSKGKLIKEIFISSTMGSSVQVVSNELLN